MNLHTTPIFSTARDIDGTSGDLHTNRPGVARMAGGFGSAPFTRRENSPGSAQDGTPSVPVESEASLLLVILHYLLKNNITFMGGIGAGASTSRRVVAAHSSCGKSVSHALHPREVGR